MITIPIDEKLRKPLYEQIYTYLRQEIENGSLKESDKLPSKRKLSAHLQVSQNTIENAYEQLIAEGYIESIEKKGYYVRKIENHTQTSLPLFVSKDTFETNSKYTYDLKTNSIDIDDFPFSIWAKLSRECLRDEKENLLKSSEPQGDFQLRIEIASYLHEFRGMTVSPEQIVIGAGTEYLLGLITELLPPSIFALENPSYPKNAQILRSKGIPFHLLPLDEEGMSIDILSNISATIPLITPSHHFPLGTVMSINRRQQFLKWASADDNRYIIEDDYDSEFRYALKPIPPLHQLDNHHKVIYLNTFTKTLAPSLRIAYMVLPPKLLKEYEKKLSFYSCPVSKFEQSILHSFLKGGYYGRHLNRMKTIYRNKRDAFLESLSPLKITIKGKEAGLHLLLNFPTRKEKTLIEMAEKEDVKVYGLSSYYLSNRPLTNTIVVGYGGYSLDDLKKAGSLLVKAWK